MSYLKGYRVGDAGIQLPDIPPVKASLRIKPSEPQGRYYPAHRPTVGAILHTKDCPLGVKGAALPRGDHTDIDSIVGGFMYRVGRGHPFTISDVRKIRRITRKVLNQHFTPLSDDDIITTEQWLLDSNYSQERIAELYAARDRLEVGDCEDFGVVKCFIKDECYTGFKHLRLIMARPDEAKILLASMFRSIEKKIFTHPAFIKKVPVDERANYIVDRLGVQGPFYVTDYSSFESSAIEPMMEYIEYEVYRYMAKGLTGFRTWWQHVERLSKNNELHFKGALRGSLKACRMSGEMNTSLGNGLLNMILMEYVAHCSGAQIKGVFEGDDGLVTATKTLDMSVLETLPVIVKLEKVDTIGEASFCGLVFEEDERQLLCDPWTTILKMSSTGRAHAHDGWKAKKALARMKALSTCFQTPSCPLVWAFSQRFLLMTTDADPKKVRELQLSDPSMKYKFGDVDISNAKPIPPSMKTRIFFAERFGVPVDTQHAIEQHFLQCNEIDFGIISDYMHPDWILYYEMYSSDDPSPNAPHLDQNWAPLRLNPVDHDVVANQ